MKILRHLHVPPVLTRPLQQDPSLSSSVRCCFQLLIGRKKSYKRVGTKKDTQSAYKILATLLYNKMHDGHYELT